MTTFSSASATDVGNSRASNQDAVYSSEQLCIVADGMGGHAGGEVAAQSAVTGLVTAFAETRSAKGLMAGAKRVNREIFVRSDKVEELRGMGTTLVAIALVPNRNSERIALINVGDSRAYLFEGGELSQLTADHSLVEEMLRNGEITRSEADVHPYRHVLTRAIGIEDRVDVDAWTIVPVNGTRIMLCSDGLTNEVADQEIAEILTANSEPSDACYALIRRALDHGGSDNVTVVVTDIVGTSATTPIRPPNPARGRQPKRPTEPAITETGGTASAAITASTAIVETDLEEASEEPQTIQRSRIRRHIPPETPSPSRPKTQKAPSPLQGLGRQIVTFRLALFSFVLLIIIAGSVGTTIWFNKASYFIGIDQQHVAIYNGRPGGFLWFKPTLVKKYPLTTSQVLPANLTLLRTGMLESSYADASRVVGNLTNELATIATVNTTQNSGTTASG
jgi:protein phosphatase